jgi:hypothetical protein
MHQQEKPGYFTRYSEADYSVYDRIIGVRFPTGQKILLLSKASALHPELARAALSSAENRPHRESNYHLSFRSEV